MYFPLIHVATSMLSTITDGFCGIVVIPSCSCVTVCICVTANTTLRTPHIPLSVTSPSAVFGHHQADFTTHNTETCSRPQDNVQCSKSCVRSDISTDGLFASPQYFRKLKFASSDGPDYSQTSVGGANRRTSNQVSPPNSALSIGGGN
jgi:hypothetical protein